MHPTCPDCDAPGVQSEEATFNVVYVCPICERQLACQYAREWGRLLSRTRSRSHASLAA